MIVRRLGGGGAVPGAVADKITHYDFVHIAGFPANTDRAVYEESDVVKNVEVPRDCSAFMAVFESTKDGDPEDCTGGTITARLTKNGSKIVDTSLDTVLDPVTNKNEVTVEIATGAITFAKGDELGVDFVSTAGWLPVDSDLKYMIYVMFD